MQSERTSVQVVEVGREENGRKLISFLEARLGSLPTGLLMRLVRTGQVRIDGRRCKPFDRVLTGQMVRIPPVNVERGEKPARDLPGLQSVFENDEMIVIDKPAGLPVHGGTGWIDSVHDRLKGCFEGQAFVPVPVHRLDRDTSGLLLCAKTHDFLRSMHAAWPTLTKAYLCWVEGTWESSGWRTIVSKLAKAETGRGEQVVSGQGKRAVSHVHPLLTDGRKSLLLVVLGTRGAPIRSGSIWPILDMPLSAIPGMAGAEGFCCTRPPFPGPDMNFFVLPSWRGEFRIERICAQDMKDILATAPAKEGAI